MSLRSSTTIEPTTITNPQMWIVSTIGIHPKRFPHHPTEAGRLDGCVAVVIAEPRAQRSSTVLPPIVMRSARISSGLLRLG